VSPSAGPNVFQLTIDRSPKPSGSSERSTLKAKGKILKKINEVLRKLDQEKILPETPTLCLKAKDPSIGLEHALKHRPQCISWHYPLHLPLFLDVLPTL